MATRRLTDRTLQALKRAEPGKRYEVMDSEVRGLGVRVNDRGRKTFILIARYPGSRHPARRSLGKYGVMTLGDAREEARANYWVRVSTKQPKTSMRIRQAMNVALLSTT